MVFGVFETNLRRGPGIDREQFIVLCVFSGANSLDPFRRGSEPFRCVVDAERSWQTSVSCGGGFVSCLTGVNRQIANGLSPWIVARISLEVVDENRLLNRTYSFPTSGFHKDASVT